MRLTMRTSLAMKTLMFCAVNHGHIVRRQEVAAACDASENHLAQVIHMLSRKGYLHTIRGRAGGLTLNRAAGEIRVGDVFRDFERVLPFTDCIGPDAPHCALAGPCRLTCTLNAALDAFYDRLDQVTVADLVSDNSGLDRLLRLA